MWSHQAPSIDINYSNTCLSVWIWDGRKKNVISCPLACKTNSQHRRIFTVYRPHACAHAGYPGSRSGEAAHVRRASRRAAVRRPRFVSCSLNCLKVRPRVAEFPSCLSNSSCIPSTLTTDPQYVGGDSVSSLGTVWTPNFGDIGIDVAFLCCRLELFTPE